MRVDLFIFHGFATERRRRSILSLHLFLSFIRRHPLGVLITFMANKPGRRRRPDTHTRPDQASKFEVKVACDKEMRILRILSPVDYEEREEPPPQTLIKRGEGKGQ